MELLTKFFGGVQSGKRLALAEDRSVNARFFLDSISLPRNHSRGADLTPALSSPQHPVDSSIQSSSGRIIGSERSGRDVNHKMLKRAEQRTSNRVMTISKQSVCIAAAMRSDRLARQRRVSAIRGHLRRLHTTPVISLGR